jgi:hypothetical protein
VFLVEPWKEQRMRTPLNEQTEILKPFNPHIYCVSNNHKIGQIISNFNLSVSLNSPRRVITLWFRRHVKYLLRKILLFYGISIN